MLISVPRVTFHTKSVAKSRKWQRCSLLAPSYGKIAQMDALDNNILTIAMVAIFACLYLITIVLRNQIATQLQNRHPDVWLSIQQSAKKTKKRFWSKRSVIEDVPINTYLSNKEFLNLNDNSLKNKCLLVNSLNKISYAVFVAVFAVNILFGQ